MKSELEEEFMAKEEGMRINYGGRIIMCGERCLFFIPIYFSIKKQELDRKLTKQTPKETVK